MRALPELQRELGREPTEKEVLSRTKRYKMQRVGGWVCGHERARACVFVWYALSTSHHSTLTLHSYSTSPSLPFILSRCAASQQGPMAQATAEPHSGAAPPCQFRTRSTSLLISHRQLLQAHRSSLRKPPLSHRQLTHRLAKKRPAIQHTTTSPANVAPQLLQASRSSLR